MKLNTTHQRFPAKRKNEHIEFIPESPTFCQVFITSIPSRVTILLALDLIGFESQSMQGKNASMGNYLQ